MLLYDSFHLPYIYNTPSVLWIFKIFYHTFHLFTSHHNYLNKNPCKWHFHTIYKGSHSYRYLPNFDKFLSIHLRCNLSRKIFFLLLNTFACLKSDKSFNTKVCAVLFCNLLYIFAYRKVTILYIYLI